MGKGNDQPVSQEEAHGLLGALVSLWRRRISKAGKPQGKYLVRHDGPNKAAKRKEQALARKKAGKKRAQYLANKYPAGQHPHQYGRIRRIMKRTRRGF